MTVTSDKALVSYTKDTGSNPVTLKRVVAKYNTVIVPSSALTPSIDYVKIMTDRITKQLLDANREDHRFFLSLEEDRVKEAKRAALYKRALKVWYQYHIDLVLIDPNLSPKHRSFDTLSSKSALKALELLKQVDKDNWDIPEDIMNRAFKEVWDEQLQ